LRKDLKFKTLYIMLASFIFIFIVGSLLNTIFDIGVKLTVFLILFILATVLIMLSTCLYIIQVLIINPISRLKEEIRNLDLENLSCERLTYRGEGEIRDLTAEINKMLSRIEETNREAQKSRKQLELVISGANVGFWDYNIQTGKLYVNKRVSEMTGFSSEEMIIPAERFTRLIFPEDLRFIMGKVRECIETNHELGTLEFRVISDSGEPKWIAVRGSIVESESSEKPLRMTGIIIDIDERKKAEHELRHLTYYDKLTGLYNRGYFEYMLEKKVARGDFPFAIIIGDINGLKIVNDTFGHEAGDKIITAIAEILKLSGRQKDIICRWGGDEFAMLLNNAADDIAEQVCAEIRERCAARQMQPISLSISLGYSIAHANRDINSAIKEAEERMYRNKLFEDKSNRSSIIASLQRTLEEKSHETEEHTRRIYDHCLKMGQKLNMGHAKIDELLLLALMHDIGKIGIPDDILNKESPLSEEEWEIMKTHTAIGYRIASASPELSHIAYGILTHHEYYNGCGYPKGLRGKSIPRISRVLSIVDAYDVMTHDRPYRKALTREQAIAELKRCSGTQFDPVLVKMFIEILEETEHMAG
jgi:diguanylate cyclase (GGDEF)-like protein/PAS domain S-box-containing protein